MQILLSEISKKPYKPRTISELKKYWPNLYEMFLISKYKSGQTFKGFVDEVFD
jgi:hypothetical protein